MNKPKLNFYGASITQQKAGYVTQLIEKCPEYDIQRSGHGGMNIINAAICYVKKVLEQTPDYCFLDWFINAPSYLLDSDHIILYIDAVVFNLVNNKITPIFLLMYGDSNQLTPKKLKFYERMEQYCVTNNIQCISLYKEPSVLKSVEDGISVVEDGIHTNDNGSKLYAEAIYNFITSKLIQNWDQIPLPVYNKYCEVKSMIIDKTITDKLTIFGKCEIVGIEQIIGPYSPWVSIEADNKTVDSVCVWDTYCHYERRQMIISGSCNELITITVEKDKPVDYSKCRREWIHPKDIEKKLKLHTLYYMGDIQNLDFK